MRKRVPIAIGGGIGLLLIASQYLNFGLGFRDGTGPGRGNEEAGQVAIDPSAPGSPAPKPIETTKPVDAEKPVDAAMREAAEELQRESAAPLRPQVVDILIDGNQYLVQTQAGASEREPMTLDQLVAYASTVSGDANGIRVRIARTPAAIASADAAVLKRLSESGLTADQIDARRQLVEPE